MADWVQIHFVAGESMDAGAGLLRLCRGNHLERPGTAPGQQHRREHQAGRQQEGHARQGPVRVGTDDGGECLREHRGTDEAGKARQAGQRALEPSLFGDVHQSRHDGLQ
jgi:hypothetical protein